MRTPIFCLVGFRSKNKDIQKLILWMSLVENYGCPRLESCLRRLGQQVQDTHILLRLFLQQKQGHPRADFMEVLNWRAVSKLRTPIFCFGCFRSKNKEIQEPILWMSSIETMEASSGHPSKFRTPIFCLGGFRSKNKEIQKLILWISLIQNYGCPRLESCLRRLGQQVQDTHSKFRTPIFCFGCSCSKNKRIQRISLWMSSIENYGCPRLGSCFRGLGYCSRYFCPKIFEPAWFK